MSALDAEVGFKWGAMTASGVRVEISCDGSTKASAAMIAEVVRLMEAVLLECNGGDTAQTKAMMAQIADRLREACSGVFPPAGGVS